MNKLLSLKLEELPKTFRMDSLRCSSETKKNSKPRVRSSSPKWLTNSFPNLSSLFKERSSSEERMSHLSISTFMSFQSMSDFSNHQSSTATHNLLPNIPTSESFLKSRTTQNLTDIKRDHSSLSMPQTGDELFKINITIEIHHFYNFYSKFKMENNLSTLVNIFLTPPGIIQIKMLILRIFKEYLKRNHKYLFFRDNNFNILNFYVSDTWILGNQRNRTSLYKPSFIISQIFIGISWYSLRRLKVY